METSPALSKNRQRKKTKPPSRAREMLVRTGSGMLNYSFSIVMLLLALAVGIYFYCRYYFGNESYIVAPEEITLRGNSVLPRDLILKSFGLTAPQNGFEILRSDMVARLQRELPLIQSVKMTFQPPRNLEIWVEERTPVARLVRPPASGVEYWPALAVDREGYIFSYPKSLQAYPEIGTRLFAKSAEPGSQWPENQRCVLHLLAVMETLSMAGSASEYSSGVKSVTLLSAEPDDGLLVSLHDGRKITIAWPNMSMEKEISPAMRKRLEQVATVMRDPATSGLKHFNAMAEDRVAGSE